MTGPGVSGEGMEAPWPQLRRALRGGGFSGWTSLTTRTVALYLLVIVLAASPAFYWGMGQLSVDAFRSPDETTAYIAATTFAEERKLYLQDEITTSATETPTGPRGFVQHDGRSVPFYPLGHSFLLGIFYLVFSGLAPLFLAAIPATLFVSLLLALRAIRPHAPVYIGLVPLGVVPLWFFASRVHIDVASSLAFVAVAFLCLVYAVQRQSLAWFAASSVGLALAALMRHQEAFFLLLLGATFMIAFLRSTGYSRETVLRTLAVYAVAQLAAFVLPLLLLNWLTYGSPFTVGYLLFYREMFPNRVPAEDASLLARGWGVIRSAVIPGPVSAEVLYTSLWYRVLLLVPIPVGLAVFALVRNWASIRRVLGWEGLTLLTATIVYVIVSRAAPGTFLAVPDDVTFVGSVARYWLPFYLVIGLGAALALSQMSRNLGLGLILLMVAYSSYHVWLSDPQQSVLSTTDSVTTPAERYESFILEHTEREALVFAGGFTDKYVVRARRTAAIMIGSQVPLSETMRRVADNARLVSDAGIPVYFLIGSSDEIEALEARFAEHGLAPHVVARAPWDPRWVLMASGPPIQEIVPGENGAEFTVPADRFAIEVAQDGSALNLVTNPSFEPGLDGWSGPSGEQVQLTSDERLFGDHALMMSSIGASDLVRRTWHVELDQRTVQAGVWSARTWVLLSEAAGVDATVRIWIKDAGGATLARYAARHGEPDTEFTPIVMEGFPLPEGAARLELQVALAPREGAVPVGATAVWDGIELVPGPRMSADYCDGDHHGCTWAGEPHASVSQRDGAIESLVLEFEDGQSAHVPGPLEQDDRLLIDEGGVVLVRGENAARVVGGPLPVHAEDPLTVRVDASNAPVLTVSEESE